MSTVINTNIPSLVARDALKLNGRAMADAMEQLSTGKRINSAADDAAGLAISQTMTAQIRSMNTAVRNANDGVSLAQTAEGALIEVSNMLQRMRELAVQASTGTISTVQREYLKTEANALGDQIDSTINNTRWNGYSVLSAANMTTGFEIQIGDQGGASALVTMNGDTSVTTVAGSRSVTVAHNADLRLADNLNGLVVGDTVRISQTTVVNGVTLKGLFRVESVAADGLNFTVQAVNVAGNATGANLTGGGATTVQKVNGLMALRGGDLSSVAKATILASGSDMSSAATSSAALAKIDTGVEAVNTARANLGASVNRLVSVVDNLTNVSQNLVESRSRILDTDYAAATTELARTMIIQQAGTAVLAQANQRPQFVLALLR